MIVLAIPLLFVYVKVVFCCTEKSLYSPMEVMPVNKYYSAKLIH